MDITTEQLNNEIRVIGTIKIQSTVRKFLVRCRTLKMVNERFEKIYDPRRKAYFYYDMKNDTSSWHKPTILLHADLLIVSPTYTKDAAALMIQRQLWRRLALRRVRRLYKDTITSILDESSGCYYYFNPKTHFTAWELPSFMGGTLDHSDDEDDDNSSDDSDVKKRKATTKGSSKEKFDDDDSKSSGSSGSSVDSDDSEKRREKRRLARKYPRSKAQALVDAIEDNKENLALNLSHLKTKHITSRIYDLDTLTSLNLSDNLLTKISVEIEYFTSLQELDLSNNLISTVPLELEELMELKSFSIRNNRIKTLPGQFFRLAKLQTLDLSNNDLGQLPLEIGNLELLKDLHEWEVGIGLLRDLKHLNVSNTSLTEWPPQLDKLQNLIHLDLSRNKLVLVSKLIRMNILLNYLDVSYNDLSSLPDELYGLPLQSLHANNNRITEFPIMPRDAVSGNTLCDLRELDLSHNQLSTLGSYLSLFISLETFSASNNMITSIDSSVSCLTNIQSINWSYNHLQDLPNTFGNCTSLTNLNLNHNRFINFPASISQLKKVNSLDLSYNMMNSLPEATFINLRMLTKLNLMNNKLNSLPTSMFSLPVLTTMNLSKNELTSFSDLFSNLTSLEHLNLSFNKIQEIPPIVSKLIRLSTLDMEWNKLGKLPSELSSIQSLRRITIANNEFVISPSVLNVITRLQHWDLSWNDIPSRLDEFDSYLNSMNVNASRGVQQTPTSNLLSKPVPVPVPKKKRLYNSKVHSAFLHRSLQQAWRHLETLQLNRSVDTSSSTTAAGIPNEQQHRMDIVLKKKTTKHSEESLQNSRTLQWFQRLNSCSCSSDGGVTPVVESKGITGTLLSMIQGKNKVIHEDNKDAEDALHRRLLYTKLEVELPPHPSHKNNDNDKDKDLSVLSPADMGPIYQDVIDEFERISHDITLSILTNDTPPNRNNSPTENTSTTNLPAQQQQQQSASPARSTSPFKLFGKAKATNDNASSSPIKNTIPLLTPSSFSVVPSMLKIFSNQKQKDPKDRHQHQHQHANELFNEGQQKRFEAVLEDLEGEFFSNPLTMQYDPIFGESDTALYMAAFECYFGLGSVLLLRIDHITRTIRQIEKQFDFISCIDVGQREYSDLEDLVSDVYGSNLDKHKKELEKQAHTKGGRIKDMIRATSQNSFEEKKVSVKNPQIPITTVATATTTNGDIPVDSEQFQIEKEKGTVMIKTLQDIRQQVIISANTALDSASELLRILGWDPLMRSFYGENSTVAHWAVHLRSIAAFFFYTRGRALQYLSQYSLARGEFSRALKIGPRWRPAQTALVKCLLAQGDFPLAMSTLTSMVEPMFPPGKKFNSIEIVQKNQELGMLFMLAEVAMEQLSRSGYDNPEQNRLYDVGADGVLRRDRRRNRIL